MKLTVSTKILAAALRQLAKVVKKGECPGVLVLPARNELSLTACDPKAGIWLTLWLRQVNGINAPGESFVLPLEQTLAVLTAVQSATIEIEVLSASITLRCNGGEWVPTMVDPATLPPVPAYGALKTIYSGHAEDVAMAIGSVQHAIATASARYTMTGLQLCADKAYLNFVTTDGRRLAIYTLDRSASNEQDGKALIPHQVLPMLTWSDAATVMLQAAKNHFVAHWHDEENASIAKLTCLQLEGNFPDYRAVVPSSVGVGTVHEVEILKSAVRQVQFMGEEDRVEVQYTAGKVAVSANSTHGTAVVEIPCEHSVETTFPVNSKYMLDALAAVEGLTVNLHHITNKNMIVLQSDSLFQVVMLLS